MHMSAAFVLTILISLFSSYESDLQSRNISGQFHPRDRKNIEESAIFIYDRRPRTAVLVRGDINKNRDKSIFSPRSPFSQLQLSEKSRMEQRRPVIEFHELTVDPEQGHIRDERRHSPKMHSLPRNCSKFRLIIGLYRYRQL